MRFAGEMLIEGALLTEQGLERQRWEEQQKVPLGDMLDPTQLEVTPELTPGGYQGPGFDLYRDRYIRSDPRSGIALLPDGEIGPAQGPNIPIKRYGDKFMPDATQPTGYRPGPLAFVNPKVVLVNQLRKDILDRGVADGTLDAAAQSGLAPRGTYVDSVRPSDSDKQFVDIMGSGFI